MSSHLLELEQKFKVKELTIYESEHWIWSLRPHQATLAAGILSLKRECTSFGELEKKEFEDLYNIISVIETTLKKVVNYDVINYMMLMMFDKQVHYHIFPRFENATTFLGEAWKDENWPAVPTLLGDPLDDEKLKEIALYIKSNI